MPGLYGWSSRAKVRLSGGICGFDGVRPGTPEVVAMTATTRQVSLFFFFSLIDITMVLLIKQRISLSPCIVMPVAFQQLRRHLARE